MPRKHALMPSPLEWPHHPIPVPPPILPVIAERGGSQLRTPLPVAIVDTREQNPLPFRRFRAWFDRIECRALPWADYSVEGMESSCRCQNNNLRLSDREWLCPECKGKHRGDRNAAQKLQSGRDSTTRGWGNPGDTKRLWIWDPRQRAPPGEAESPPPGGEVRKPFLYDWLDCHGHARYPADGDR
jgi:hypothetical protein